MKILHVLYSGLGGHGNVFFSMVRANTQHEFIFEALFNGIEELRSEYKKNCGDMGIQWNFIKKKPGLDIIYYKSLVRIIKKSDAEIIFLHSSAYILPAIHANLLSKQKKKILIRETQANNLKKRSEWRWLSMAFLLANKVVFLSEEYRKEVQKKLHGLYRKNKVEIIPNGIDLTIFQPAENIKDTIIIGMQSRLTNNKDHVTLLHAFALLKEQGHNNIKLKIAGDGTCKQELMLLTQKLKIENDVFFTGILEEREVAKFLQQLTIYIHASFGETMSTALMQAMACGLPIIASDVPGINNMIEENYTGILVPVKNAQLMAEAINHLLNNRSFAEELALNALSFAKLNYSNLTMFKRYKEVFTA